MLDHPNWSSTDCISYYKACWVVRTFDYFFFKVQAIIMSAFLVRKLTELIFLASIFLTYVSSVNIIVHQSR